jgi:hypothetical protein
MYHLSSPSSLPWIVKPAPPAEHAFYDAISGPLQDFIPGYGGVLRRWVSLLAANDADDAKVCVVAVIPALIL